VRAISSIRSAYAHGVDLHFIEPGKPNQNAHVESFNGRLRDVALGLQCRPTPQIAPSIDPEGRRR